MDTQTLTLAAPILGAVGLAIALGILFYVKSMPVASKEMGDLAAQIHKGAMVSLRSEYSLLLIFVALVAAVRVRESAHRGGLRDRRRVVDGGGFRRHDRCHER